MFILSSSNRRQLGFATYHVPLKKNSAQILYTSLSVRNSQKLAKAAKKQTSNEHIVCTVSIIDLDISLP